MNIHIIKYIFQQIHHAIYFVSVFIKHYKY
jgi:hypothetical protein